MLKETRGRGGPNKYTFANFPAADWNGEYEAPRPGAANQDNWYWGAHLQLSTMLTLLTPQYKQWAVQEAYHQVHGRGKQIIPTAAGVTPLATREPEAKVEGSDEMQRARETSDVMWRLNNYKTIPCDCGAKLRVPPRFKEPKITCPHCGRTHSV